MLRNQGFFYAFPLKNRFKYLISIINGIKIITMKKLFTFLTLVLFVNLCVFAQLTRTNPSIFKNAVPKTDKIKTGNEVLPIAKGSYLKSAAIPSYGDTVGYTWYDYQTNGGMQQRIYQDDAGNIQVVWTKAVDTIRDPGNALRGIGYNYYDAGAQAWVPGDSNNTGYGLAEKRVGWPSIAPIAGNGEAIFAHTDRLYTSTKGASDYTPSDLGGGNLHVRTGVTFYHSTAEGNTIYTTYSNGSTMYFGRSDDAGATWSVKDFAFDSVSGCPLRETTEDAVDLDAKGDTLLIVAGGNASFTGTDPNNVNMYLSTDRGNTFTCTTIHIFDTVNAALDTASGGYQVLTPHADVRGLIGNDGTIHCTGGITAVLTDPGSLSASSWYPATRGLWYWNSTMPVGFDVNDTADYSAYVLFDSVPDMTTMGDYPTVSDDFGSYTTGMFSHPGIFTDGNGNLGIIYSGVCAGSDNNPFDNRYRRDLYYLQSKNNGMSWSDPVNVASALFANDVTDGTVGEEAYPATIKRVTDGNVYCLFQHDNYAGPFLNDPFPVTSENKLTVVTLPFPFITGLENQIERASFALYPNPAQGNVTLSFSSDASGEIEINIANMIGQSMKLVSKEIRNGENAFQLDISDLSKGIYLVTLGSGENKITQKLIIE